MFPSHDRWGDGVWRDIKSKQLLLLLANSPYEKADKNLDQVIDIGELNKQVKEASFVFVNGVLYTAPENAEDVYPKIEKDDMVLPQPSFSPTPSVSLSASTTPTPTPTSTPTPTPTPSASSVVAPSWVDITSDTFWTTASGDGLSTAYTDPCWEASLSGASNLVLEILPAYEDVEITGIRCTVTVSGTGGTNTEIQFLNDAIDNTPGEDGYTSVMLADDVPQTIEVTGISGTLVGGEIQVTLFAFSGSIDICEIEILTTETLP